MAAVNDQISLVPMNIFDSGATKLLSYRKEVTRWLAGDQVTPVCVEIQPTERCQHRCPECQAIFALQRKEVRGRARGGQDLDLALLGSLWERPPDGVVISGNTGDPLLHPRITDLMGDLAAREIPYVLICNGEGLTADAAAVAANSARGIRVSLDAHDADSFLRAHGVAGGAWERVLAGLSTALRERRVPSDCLIGAGYLTDENTRAGMVAAARLVRDLGADYIQFRPYHYRACDISAELAECMKLEDGRFRVLASGQKYSRSASPGRSYSRCHGAAFYTVIDARGDVYLCCHHVGNPAARTGSLRDTPWPELLTSQLRRDVLAGFETASCVPLCRLDSHNTMLEQVRRTGDIPQAALSGDVLAHRIFL